MYSPLTESLIKALKNLPGIGPKSAQRIAFEILRNRRQQAGELADALKSSIEQVQLCNSCRFWTEQETCKMCLDPKRDNQVLCVVESPSDVVAIEQTLAFKGHYYVLHGKLSPMDGLGPEQLGLNQLKTKAAGYSELILALTPSLEGEATSHFIINSMQNLNIRCSKIAQGIPMGGELDYLDGNTVAKALSDRIFTNE